MRHTPRPAHVPVPSARRTWEPPSLRSAGTIGEVLKGGTSKMTAVAGDPGEPQKPGPNDL